MQNARNNYYLFFCFLSMVLGSYLLVFVSVNSYYLSLSNWVWIRVTQIMSLDPAV